MRYATFKTGSGTTAARKTEDGWRQLNFASVSDLLAHTPSDKLAHLQLGEPIPAAAEPTLLLPTPRKIMAAGLNYSDHILETGRDLPSHPTLFAKFADTLTGPYDTITLPSGLSIDWEAELAVVVGATLRGASRQQALAGIAGYTIANDISMRDWQYRTLQWLQGKAWDATTPVGPELVTPDEFDPVAGADISCRVNGEQMQSDNTRTLVFDSAELVAYASTFTTLRPGDLILTGTPGGIGGARDPKIFLQDADVVETEIQGLGQLRNQIRIRG